MENLGQRESGINEIFEQRKLIYKLSVPYSASRRRALKTLRSSDATFEDWRKVHDDSESDPNLQKVSLCEMFKRAITPYEWKCVYVRSTPGSKKREEVIRNILEIDATFKEWDAINNDPDSDSALRKVAIYKMKEVNLFLFLKNYVKIREEGGES